MFLRNPAVGWVPDSLPRLVSLHVGGLGLLSACLALFHAVVPSLCVCERGCWCRCWPNIHRSSVDVGPRSTPQAWIGPTSSSQAWMLAQHPALKRGCWPLKRGCWPNIHRSSVHVGPTGPTSTAQAWMLVQHPPSSKDVGVDNIHRSSVDVGRTPTFQAWMLAQHPTLKRKCWRNQAWMLAQHPPLKRGCWHNIRPTSTPQAWMLAQHPLLKLGC